MLGTTQTAKLVGDLENLQVRIANSYLGPARTILLSVSLSDWQGNVLQTIQPEAPSSTAEYISWVPRTGSFADGVTFSTDYERKAALYEVSARFFALVGFAGITNRDVIVNATLQVSSLDKAVDLVVQTYVKDGKLVVRERVVVDNS